MNIKILVGQRTQQYEGQYAIEVLAAIDELGNRVNPGYLIKEHKEYSDSKEFDAISVITVKVDSKKVEKRLYPKAGTIDGEIA